MDEAGANGGRLGHSVDRGAARADPRATAWKAALLAQHVITDARDDVLRIGLGLYLDEEDVAPFCEAVKKALG